MSLSTPNVAAPAVAAASGTIRVLIVDDEPLARDCMRLACARRRIISFASNCRAARLWMEAAMDQEHKNYSAPPVRLETYAPYRGCLR